MDRRDRAFSYRYRGFFRFFGVVIAISLGLGAFYLLSLLGPKKVSQEDIEISDLSEEASEFLTQSEEFERKFVEVTGIRDATPEDLSILTQAIDFQKKYFKAIGGNDRDARERLEELDALYQDHVARGLLKESIEFEREGMNYLDAKEGIKALKPLRSALKIQKRIDLEYPKSRARNVTRTLRLEREVRRLTGLPLYQKTLDSEKNALDAIKAKDWKRAKSEYKVAIEAQRKLNMNYQGLQYANLNRLKSMESELDSLRSSNLQEEIDNLVKEGDEKQVSGAYREAADIYQQASRKQKQLNKEFEKSRFASASRLEEFQQMIQTALSQELGQDILKEVRELDKLLRQRSGWQAVELINGLYPKAERFKENFPRSKILDADILEKLQYLSFIQADLSFFQDRIYGQLIPLPNDESFHMLKSEVSQALYKSVALSNPSRTKGERLPVDALTYLEAKTFCQKISWILARPARLPKKEEFLSAVGSLRYVKLDDIAWFSENSDELTRPVGQKNENALGFFDLLGNVGEWLDSADIPGEEEAYIAGGTAEDSIDKLMDIPVIIGNASSRNRTIGFRFVVEIEP